MTVPQADEREVRRESLAMHQQLPESLFKRAGIELKDDGTMIFAGAKATDAYKMFVIERAIRYRAETGMVLARNTPTVKSLVKRYPKILKPNTRTYKQAYEQWKAYLDKEFDRK